MNGEAKPARAGMRAALQVITDWQVATQQSTAERVAELDAEEAQLREDLAELQRQLGNVTKMRAEATETLQNLPAEYERRTHSAILSGLGTDAAAISERGSLYMAAVAARDANAASIMEQPGVAAKVQEFEEFEQRREALLSSLPKSYHAAILSQHDAVRAELQPLLDALSAEMEPVSDEVLDITLVASMDSVDGVPEALAVILPVSYQIHAAWDKRDEDLAALLAYRVVAAVSGALKQAGVPDAPVVYAPYEYGDEQLAIQVWLKDSNVSASLEAALESEVERMASLAGELHTAGLRVAVTWQPPEIIAPNTTEQED